MLINLTMVLLIFFIFVLLVRVVFAKTQQDMLVFLNLMTVKLVLLIVLYAVKENASVILDIALTYSMIGFLSMMLLANLVTKGGRMR